MICLIERAACQDTSGYFWIHRRCEPNSSLVNRAGFSARTQCRLIPGAAAHEQLRANPVLCPRRSHLLLFNQANTKMTVRGPAGSNVADKFITREKTICSDSSPPLGVCGNPRLMILLYQDIIPPNSSHLTLDKKENERISQDDGLFLYRSSHVSPGSLAVLNLWQISQGEENVLLYTLRAANVQISCSFFFR